MISYPTSRRRPARSSASARWLGTLVKFFLMLSLIGVVGWLIFQKTVHSQLRDQIQAKLDAHTAGTLLTTRIGNATFVEGQGIRINDLQMSVGSEGIAASRSKSTRSTGAIATGTANSKIQIYETFVHLPVTMTELVSSNCLPTAIEFRRAKLQLTQNEAGDWNVPQLIEQLSALKTPDAGPIPVRFIDCTIELMTPNRLSAGHNSNPMQLTDVSLELLPIQHEGRALLQIQGHFNGRETYDANFVAYLDQSAGNWQSNFEIQQYRLTDSVVELLPAKFRERFQSLPKVTGALRLAGFASGDMNLHAQPKFQFSGSLADFNCDDPNLPLPIRQTQLDFSIDNDGLQVTNAQGKLGAGSFQFGYQQVGLRDRESWSATGQLIDFDFSHHRKFTAWLPGFCGKLCSEYSPAGTADVSFKLMHDGSNLVRELHGQLTDMSFSYDRMPYRVDHCVGEVDLIDDDCRLSVRSTSGQQVMELKGFVKHPGPDATYQINILVPGDLPIDDKMLTAIKAQPKLAEIVSDFNPTGRVGGIGRIEKNIPNGPVSKSFDVRLKQCIVKHNSFDYPIHNVNGLVQVHNDQYSFVELTGHNSSAEIGCNGSWTPNQGLDVKFICKSVPLDNQLRYALRPDLREIWAGFRPRGTADLIKVDLTLPINETDCNVVVDATMSKPQAGVEPNLVSINPIWFPYEIKRLTGNVIIGDGKIVLTDMAGQHGRSWLVCQGDGHYADDSWSVKLKELLVGSLKVDDDLLAAVPRDLAPPIRQLSFAGLLNVQGEITLAGQTEPPAAGRLIGESRNSLAWKLRFDMNQAKMLVGLPLENVFGSVNLRGTYDGENAACQGDLKIDSLTVYDAQITNLVGPIWLDNQRAAAGVFAKPIQNSQVENVAPGADPTASIASVTGSMHGGVVKFDGQMSSDPAGEFYLQTTLADGDLKQFCREFAPQLTDITGRSFAALKLAGNYLGTHSYRGDGTVQLRDAKIYELPVMLSLLKILKIREATRTAFDASNVDFTVSGEDVELNRIEMLGDAISLLGNGKVNLDREIDLNFYSVMGRNRINIPVITDMYRASSQQVLWINVDGTLDNPQTHRNVLPQINDSLKLLFQPAEQHRMARKWDNANRAETAPSPNGLMR